MRKLMVLTMVLVASSACGADWPRWLGPRGDGVWDGPAIAEKLTADALPVVWKQSLGGGYSGITVAEGRAYTMDRPGGDDGPRDAERILCFDAATGQQLWSHEYPADYGDLTYNSGPRASVTIHQGKAYALGAVGHVHCLDAATGKLLWRSDTVKEHAAERPTWGFAAAPFIYEDLVLLQIATRPIGCLVAFHKDTGDIVWRASEDPAGYCTPVLIDHPSGSPQLILWSPQNVIGLDPRTGEVHWKYPFEIRYGVAIAVPVYREGLLFVSDFWKGSHAFRLGPGLGDVELVWTNEREVRGLMSQALYRDGYGYILDRDYGMTCFEFKTGKKVWDDGNKMTPKAQHPQAVVVGLAGTDRALVLNSAGQLIHARLTPAGYEELWRTPIIGETWAHPAFHGQTLIARSDSEIVCVRLPVAGE